MPLPAIDINTLLTDEEENLKLEQINATHLGILDLLGDPGNPLYAKPHSMAEHFDAMMIGTHSIGELPSRGHCRDLRCLPVCTKTKPGRPARRSLGAWMLGCWMAISLSRHAYECPCSFSLLGASCSYIITQMPRGVMLHSSPAAAKAFCNPGETLDSPSCLGASGCSLLTYERLWMHISTGRSWRMRWVEMQMATRR